jgi:uncharacterized protein (TIGR02594 family)
MTADPPWIARGRQLLGTREVPGPEQNPVINGMWAKLKMKLTEDDPWCAGFVGYCLADAGIAGSGSAAARSYLKWGMELPAAVYGCVVVFSRPGNSWSGHVGFVVGRDGHGRLLVLGGNQGDAVTVVPFDVDRVLGYRWPSGVTLPAFSGMPEVASAGKSSEDEA